MVHKFEVGKDYSRIGEDLIIAVEKVETWGGYNILFGTDTKTGHPVVRRVFGNNKFEYRDDGHSLENSHDTRGGTDFCDRCQDGPYSCDTCGMRKDRRRNYRCTT